MKKFLALTSILALVACGGGSGGDGSVATNGDVIRAGSFSHVTADAAKSNAALTGMVSEIGVAEDGTTINVGNVRAASVNSFNYNGKTYVSHRLDEVKFAMADEGFGGEMKFDIDTATGQINGFELLPDDENHDGEPDDPEDTGMQFSRKPDSQSVEFDGQVNTETGPKDAVLTYVSKGNDLGLKYSDFGYFDIDVVDNWRPVFIGGYDGIKKIDVNNIQNTPTFTGKAIGSVMAKRTIGGVLYEDQEQLPLEGNATLEFNNGTSVLTTGFNNWYKNVVYTENGNNKSITLSDYHDTPVSLDNGNEEHRISSQNNYYRFADNDNPVEINNETKLQYHDENINHIESDIRYYGSNNVAEEAVGMIQVNDCVGGICDADVNPADQVRMNLSFGAK